MVICFIEAVQAASVHEIFVAGVVVEFVVRLIITIHSPVHRLPKVGANRPVLRERETFSVAYDSYLFVCP